MVINGKKSRIVVSILISLTLFCLVTFQNTAQAQDKVFKVGISQFVEHPALDSAREGFIEGLKEAGFIVGENLEINLENAQADMSTTQTIAQKFENQNLDFIHPIVFVELHIKGLKKFQVIKSDDLNIIFTLDSIEAIKAVSSPQTKAPAPTLFSMSKSKPLLKILRPK